MMIATVALAQRVAEERGVVLGGEVWYAIRYSEKFREYFDCCPVRNIPGFLFPVEIMYCKTGGGAMETDFLKRVVDKIEQIHVDNEGTDGMLVFLPGYDEIGICCCEQFSPQVPAWPPHYHPALVQTALTTLMRLDAFDNQEVITTLGRTMADFPLNPVLAKMLISSVELGCSDQVLTVVPMLSVKSVFVWQKKGSMDGDRLKMIKQRMCDPSGDHLTLLNIFTEWVLWLLPCQVS